MDLSRVAGAPISWGVCEVPGWGYQLDAGRVLAEMSALGLAATEFGPDGFLPDDPADRAALLAGYGLASVGGFVPVVLHVDGHDPVAELRTRYPAFRAANAGVVVLSADLGGTSYDGRAQLSTMDWQRLLANLDAIVADAADHGLLAVLHPHVGTAVERAVEVRRVLDGCSIPLCLDTGHLLIGGTDPAELARTDAARVEHVHLKDVDAGLAAKVRDGSAGYSELVGAGLYTPLGRGDVDVASIVTTLESAGYTGWYVLEQDVTLTAEPPPGAGPVEDVRACLDFLRALT